MRTREFSLSANIGSSVSGSAEYIITPNVRRAAGEIVSAYQAGVHSFTIIGTYGTGKSCFLVNLEKDLLAKSKPGRLVNASALSPSGSFEILNVVGEYSPLEGQLSANLPDAGNAIVGLRDYAGRLKAHGKTLLIVIDEFGKVLEYAAKHNPEKELYFMQKLAEFANVPNRNVLLLTTLHQNFSAYASMLSVAQRNEWNKVKGRFQEIAFAEPVEQLLYMAAECLDKRGGESAASAVAIHELALRCKFVTASFSRETAIRLRPLDAFSAIAITKAIQRYGQNERSLFSFLSSKGRRSLSAFPAEEEGTYSLCDVYDYILSSFYSYITDANVDSMGWGAINVAIERIETADWASEGQLTSAVKAAKVIGMLNLFGNAGFKMSADDLACYLRMAARISDADIIIRELSRLKIIRYAEYKGRYTLFEGTDINIEEEVSKAAAMLPASVSPVDEMRRIFAGRIAPVKASYYHRGTPRYFEYAVCDAPQDLVAKDDVDGYIELVFPEDENVSRETAEASRHCEHAVIFVVFERTEDIVRHLRKMLIYGYILDKVLIDKSDNVALREVTRLRQYEQESADRALKDSLLDGDKATWFYKGAKRTVRTLAGFNKLLSEVCEDVYPLAPVISNELINKQKLGSSISAARVKYLQALVSNSVADDLGFAADKFPPEKTIYCTLLKNTGLHSRGGFSERPSDEGVMSLWNACEHFLDSTREKQKSIKQLIDILSAQPYKMKAGLLDFWIPTYLYIKRQDFSLFSQNGTYIPEVNMEFFELLKKHPKDFYVKALVEDGVKLAFYNQYRKLIGKSEAGEIREDKFIEVIKPFFFFYNRLNQYAKTTRKFESVTTLRFRDVLAKAKDPEKTFFEDLPEALGYTRDDLTKDEFVGNYCALIQKAVRELRSCYRSLIDRIEEQLVERLALGSYDYTVYVAEIRGRLAHVKQHLLNAKQKDFFSHAMAEFDNREQWYQSVCYAALGQPLERLRDEQEAQLSDNLVYLFRECEKQAVVSEAMDFPATDEDRRRSGELERKIDAILSGESALDVYALLETLKRKMA